MRVRKAHFKSFIEQYKGDKSNVTEVHSAYQKEINDIDKRRGIHSTRRVYVPCGISELNKEIKKTLPEYEKNPELAKYKLAKIEVTTKTGITKKWIALQLRKNNII